MIRPPLHAAISTLTAALLAAGCASFDGLATKAVRTDAAELSADKSLAEANVSAAAWPAANWWQRFGDPQLDALIAEALAGNPGVGAARARIVKDYGLPVAGGLCQANIAWNAGLK